LYLKMTFSLKGFKEVGTSEPQNRQGLETPSNL
jgi:hypothetical protein